jgi:hypothetical protein
LVSVFSSNESGGAGEDASQANARCQGNKAVFVVGDAIMRANSTGRDEELLMVFISRDG